MPKVTVDFSKCKGCFSCVEICPMEVYARGPKLKIAKEADCIGCRACEVQCPAQCIKITD